MKVNPWIVAIRPKTLGASMAPVLLGTAIAKSSVGISYPLFAVTLFTAILLQIASNLVNDYFDFKKGADTADRTGPTRAMQAGLVSSDEMKNAISMVVILIVAFGGLLVWVGGLPILIIGLASILCAFMYTAGPYPLAYLGLGDLFVFIFFGPVAVAGTYFLQTHRFDSVPVLLGIPVGLFSIAILTVNNVRDFPQDLAVHKKTVVVRWGVTYGKIQYTLCLLMPFLLTVLYFFLGYAPRAALLSLVLFPICFPMLNKIWNGKQASELNPLLARTAQVLLLFSVSLSLAWFFNG